MNVGTATPTNSDADRIASTKNNASASISTNTSAPNVLDDLIIPIFFVLLEFLEDKKNKIVKKHISFSFSIFNTKSLTKTDVSMEHDLDYVHMHIIRKAKIRYDSHE